MTDLAIDNTPIRPMQLQQALERELRELGQRAGGSLQLEYLGRQKEVADSTTKVLVRTDSGNPVAVIICSRPIAPELVSRGTDVAETIRGMVGEELGEAIIRPIGSGHVEGVSYVILPWCREFSSFKPMRVLQRWRLQRPLLDWLAKANAAAVRSTGTAEDASSAYADALQHLVQLDVIDRDVKAGVREAMKRLESGHWSPRHTFDHNDLWLGNVMLPGGRVESQRPRFPFVLIDWAGANPRGFGIYDLIRLALTMRMSPNTVRRELAAHSDALGCAVQDTRGHLLAALGRLHQHLEHFPERHYVRTFQRCWQTFNGALGGHA